MNQFTHTQERQTSVYPGLKISDFQTETEKAGLQKGRKSCRLTEESLQRSQGIKNGWQKPLLEKETWKERTEKEQRLKHFETDPFAQEEEAGQKGILHYVAGEQVIELHRIPPKDWDSLTRAARTVWCTRDLLIDEYGGVVYRDGEVLEMGRSEFEILTHLVKHSTMYVNRDALLVILEGVHRHSLSDNTLSKHINRLRTKLGGSRDTFVSTTKGSGYKWRQRVEKMYITR